MEPAYRHTPVAHREPIEAMLQMRMPGGEEIAAAMLVKQPRTLSPEIEIVLEEVRSSFESHRSGRKTRTTAHFPTEAPFIVSRGFVRGSGQDFSVVYEAMCTRALILTSSEKSSEPSGRQLARILLKSTEIIAPGR